MNNSGSRPERHSSFSRLLEHGRIEFLFQRQHGCADRAGIDLGLGQCQSWQRPRLLSARILSVGSALSVAWTVPFEAQAETSNSCL